MIRVVKRRGAGSYAEQLGVDENVIKASVRVDCTSMSKSKEFPKEDLSPLYLGPVHCYDDVEAKTLENAWQYSKVYECMADSSKNPRAEFFDWQREGFADKQGTRYPMGAGAAPLYSYWKVDGEFCRLDYVKSRKLIYIPEYAKLFAKTGTFKKLLELKEQGKDIILADFDGYNNFHPDFCLDYNQVIHYKVLPMGHAFVIAMMLEGLIKVDGDKVTYAKGLLTDHGKEIHTDYELKARVNAGFGEIRAAHVNPAPAEDEVELTESDEDAIRRRIVHEKRCSQLFRTTRTTLLRRVNSGDRKAFEEFYNYYCPAMRAYLGVSEEGDSSGWDIIQTVFTKIYKAFAMIEDPVTGAKRMPRNLLATMVRYNKETGKTETIKFRQYLITCMKYAKYSKWRHDAHDGKMKFVSFDSKIKEGSKTKWVDVFADRRPNPRNVLIEKERKERNEIALAIWPVVVNAYLSDESLDDCVREITHDSILGKSTPDELAEKWGVKRNYVDQIKYRGVKKAGEITRAIYELMVPKCEDIDAEIKRLYEAVAAMKPSKHIDKFMIKLAKDLLAGKK